MLQDQHLNEWLASGVSPAAIALNVKSVDGQEAIELILSDAIAQRQKVTSYHTVGTTKLLEHYSHLEAGGWWVSGLDPLNDWQPMQWGQLKPDSPRPDPYKPGKDIKYEQPLKASARCLYLRITWNLGIKVAQRNEKTGTYIQRLLQEFKASLGETERNLLSAAFHEGVAAALGDWGDQRPQDCPGSRRRDAGDVRDSRLREEDSLSLLRRQHLSVFPRFESFCRSEDLGFWRWIREERIAIILTEGAKKAASLLSIGYAAIALPGITMGAQREDSLQSVFRLHPDLEPFATPGREVNLCFDFETRFKTIQAIERETEKLGALFRKAGCEFRVVELPGPEKGVDDFIVAQGETAFHDLFAQRLTLDRWQAKRLSRLTHPATVTLNQRYLGDLDLPANAPLIAIKSPKGTGKTESFKKIVADANENGQRVLLISHRVQLAQAICDRVSLPYVTELRTAEEGSLLGYGLCIDSLHPESQARFNADYWHGAIVIIDEAEQVFWHLLNAKTEVASRRTTILDQLKRLLVNTVESGGKIILSDADLSNQSLEFVWGMIEQRLPAHLILNRWQPESEAWQVFHYGQRKPDQWLAGLCAEIESGGKPFIVTQSQKAKSLWGTTTLERHLRRQFPGIKILRVDSETIADPTHPAYLCTSKLNEILGGYDVAIASPSIETGVSIDLRGHFTSVWGCLNGVSPENSARQFLARLRDPVDRHLWIAPKGIGTVANGSASVRAILKAEYQVANVTANLVETIAYNEDLLSAFSASLNAWAKMAARINAGLVQYRATVLDGLRSEGHTIHEWHPALNASELLEALKVEREMGHLEECEAVAAAPDIDQKQFDKLKAQKAKNPDERHQERKFQIAGRYQVKVTPDLVAKDDAGWYSQLRLFYFLGIGKVFLKERDEQSLDASLKSSGPWIPTLNRFQLSTRVWLLEQLGIQALLNLEAEFNGGTKSDDYANAHPALLALAAKATRHSWEVKCALGLTISEKMSPIQIAQTLLGKLGIKLQFTRQVGGKGNRQRLYCYELPKDGRDAILAQWFARDNSARQQAMHTPGIEEELGKGAA